MAVNANFNCENGVKWYSLVFRGEEFGNSQTKTRLAINMGNTSTTQCTVNDEGLPECKFDYHVTGGVKKGVCWDKFPREPSKPIICKIDEQYYQMSENVS